MRQARRAAAAKAIERRFNAYVQKLGAWMRTQPSGTLTGLSLVEIAQRFEKRTGTSPPVDYATLRKVIGQALDALKLQKPQVQTADGPIDVGPETVIE